MARELLSKEDGFIFAKLGGQEYVIENIGRVATHANIDDSVMHWGLNLRQCTGNIMR